MEQESWPVTTAEIAATAEVCEEDEKSSHSELLLAYTYYLDKKQTLKIQIGFDIENFTATITFHRHQKLICRMNYLEYYAFYNEFVHGQKKLTNKGYLLNFESNGRKKKITLKMEEYMRFSLMQDFIKAVMSYNSGAELNVQEYISKYIEKCIEKDKLVLEQEDFYIPMSLHIAQCNYSRLFYEIPLFLQTKIYFATINKTNIF